MNKERDLTTESLAGLGLMIIDAETEASLNGDFLPLEELVLEITDEIVRRVEQNPQHNVTDSIRHMTDFHYKSWVDSVAQRDPDVNQRFFEFKAMMVAYESFCQRSDIGWC